MRGLWHARGMSQPAPSASSDVSSLRWLALQLTPVRTLDDGRESRELLRVGLVRSAAPGTAASLDLPDGPAERAAGLRRLVPGDGTVVLTTAAWVHLGGRPPLVVDVAVPEPRLSRRRGIRLRITRHRPDGVAVLGGVRVTTRVQTAADLARAAHGAQDDGAADALAALLAAGVDRANVRTLLLTEPRRQRGRLALEVLAGTRTG
ncbi:hypothetical protein EDD28_3029 [Salana multivorans]|uniref:Transcriptional regulator with AbiEi antitoxin domain of type IV toxin-antitoxin system n=2 Tax=Salana multivorans TaxID=120377 RepID=A0A3N2D1I9_9MICO|nr:hypothetical protein EDD28_3029 [Salana multivorans]